MTLFALSFLQINAQEWKTPIYTKNSWKINMPTQLDKQKRNILLITEASAYTIALAGLNQLWYANYPKSNFHFINDNNEWLQMDKLGHMSSSYYTGVVGIKVYKWAGFNRNNAIWYGGLSGSLFLTIIEILDGHSAEWGASSGDLIANTCGSLLAIFQALEWNEQRIQLKYSYSPSEFAAQNPAQLGSNHLERALKDYNGQTYWLSFNLKSLFQIKDKDFPNWLSFSLGYSATEMLSPYSFKNYKDRRRNFLLSFDVDLSKIKTKYKVLNSVLHTFGFLKFPAPTIQLSNGNMHFYPIYF